MLIAISRYISYVSVVAATVSSYICICDPAWENRAYMHIEFAHFLDFKVWSFYAQTCIVYQWNFYN